jgi:hypothetical protein
MRRELPVLAVLLGTGIASFQPCLAAASDRTKHLTVSAFGGYQTYAMSDVNRAIGSTLASFPGSQAHKNEIKSGAGFGGSLRIWPSDRVFASLEFQRLLASNSGSGSYLGSNYTVDLDVPASSVTMSAGYVPRPGSALRFGLCGGVGYYVTTGRVVTKGPGVNDMSNLEGSGFGAHGFGLVMARLRGRLVVEVDAGYRYAKTTDVTANGSRIRNADGSQAKIDWSGFMGRAGLTFWATDR